MLSMSINETASLIEATRFDICVIDGTPRSVIIQQYPTRKDGAYYLEKFERFLKDRHNVSLKDYCKKHLNIVWPTCPISGEEVGYKLLGKGLVFSKFKKGRISKEHCPNFKLACDKFSAERKGSGNPMFGKKPWNLGKDTSDPRVKSIAEKRRGIKTPENTRAIQSASAKRRKIHGHTGHLHSDQTKEKLRLQTAQRWAAGGYSRVTGIHVKMREFLSTLSLTEPFKEEFQVKYFSMDFAFPLSKIAIECQGTFFHVDPRIYPNGPINAIQRRNFGRDKTKRKICCDQEGWTILEVWETEINDNSFKEQLLCKLSELNLIKQ